MTYEITDEMVEKAYKALLGEAHNADGHTRIRAALEAVAPLIRAQGMREAYQTAASGRDSGYTLDYIMAATLARITELEWPPHDT